MTARVWDDATVEAAAQAIYSAMWVEGETRGTWRNLIPAAQERWRNRARAALTAAADAVEGAIRAEALAGVIVLADEYEALAAKCDAVADEFLSDGVTGREESPVYENLRDAADLRGQAKRLRAVLGDPDAAAKHNAAMKDAGWREGVKAAASAHPCCSWPLPDSPYRTSGAGA